MFCSRYIITRFLILNTPTDIPPHPIISFLFIKESLSIRTRHIKKILKLPNLTLTGRVFHLQEAEEKHCICYFFIVIARMSKKTTQKRSD